MIFQADVEGKTGSSLTSPLPSVACAMTVNPSNANDMPERRADCTHGIFAPAVLSGPRTDYGRIVELFCVVEYHTPDALHCEHVAGSLARGFNS